jgi:hypothetical protein
MLFNEGQDMTDVGKNSATSTEYKKNPYFINEDTPTTDDLLHEPNPKEVEDGLRESYILSQPKTISVWTAIMFCILVAFVVFFAQRNYLKGELIEQAKMIAQQQEVIQRQGTALDQTASIINQVTWPKKIADAWRQIGYKVNSETK